ncbi:hypothetical protein ACFL3S_13135, partial [Gemmatimonadota bacterium]
MPRESILTDLISTIPYRLALAGGWIDQPFMSRHDPSPPGSMVVVGLEPTSWFMERAGIATSTRKTAVDLWNGIIPDRPFGELVRELYAEENREKTQPSGSQDMVGLIYPGVSRLDYDYEYEGGVFPKHIESTTDPEIASWLQSVIHILPLGQRPLGYDPLTEKRLDPGWVRRLGQTGQDCYEAILNQNTEGLGSAMSECMACWEVLLPASVRCPSVNVDLLALLRYYQDRYEGAAFSG